LEGEGGKVSFYFLILAKTEKLGISDWKTHSRARSIDFEGMAPHSD